MAVSQSASRSQTTQFIMKNRGGGCSRRNPQSAVSTAFTHVESVELVLPPHANHHGNTSGRQIMAWMENAATVAASRLCGRFPSEVCRHVPLQRALLLEACNCEEWTANKACHINSASLIYQLSNTPGDYLPVPQVTYTNKDGERRYLSAIVRKIILMARKHTLSCKEEAPISVPRDKRNQVYLGFNNVAALTVLTGEKTGEASSINDRIGVFVHEELLLCVQVQMVMTSALHAFTLLADLTLRPLWGTLSL
ncbi:LOW QUALITY PROTEIN: acetyl-coenzyme A thioesterase [Oncorhynchus nerka]|uniref:LOW QUALITY PROTEIN: acetyl-coenzyme A thioesterase n=1 Tax=Oncorhynchus nerka TaxID=8023 RepID=UPI0031B7F061